VNWQGFYVGGQGGYGSSDENFSGSGRTLVASLLAGTLIENQMGVSQADLGFSKAHARTSGFGAFAGYNGQWDDVVLGLEASWLHGNFGGASVASRVLGPQQLSDGLLHGVLVNATSAIAISDMATFRLRAGYTWGCFLPYMFGGLALGNADITRTAIVTEAVADPANPANFFTRTYGPATDAVHNHLIYGYSAGLGADVNLVGGLFMRAEWEYIRFTAAVDTNINTVRAGLGYKF
jgi:opacity protein-like surface antigen